MHPFYNNKYKFNIYDKKKKEIIKRKTTQTLEIHFTKIHSKIIYKRKTP